MRIKIKTIRIPVPQKPPKLMEKRGKDLNRFERKKSKKILRKSIYSYGNSN